MNIQHKPGSTLPASPPSSVPLASPGNEIAVTNLSKSYGAGEFAKQAVQDCGFTIERGKLTVILGPSVTRYAVAHRELTVTAQAREIVSVRDTIGVNSPINRSFRRPGPSRSYRIEFHRPRCLARTAVE